MPVTMPVTMLLGTKKEMSQLFADDGKVTPVTILEVGPCPVVQVKNVEDDGYDAVQLGFGAIRLKRVSKPLKGHFKRAGVEPTRRLHELRLKAPAEQEEGDVIKVGDVFKVGDWIDVVGRSKGRGFQGGIKRHGFRCGPRSHGSKNKRMLGSTGAATSIARVIKGTRMPGHMGDRRITTRNLLVAKVDEEKNLIYVRGSVPGFNGAAVVIRQAVAKRARKVDRALRKGK